MAIGPIARMLAQLVVPVVAVLARALPAAYAQALANARRSGAAAANSAAESNILRPNRISTSEALQILNFSSQSEATVENIEKQYEKYMKANEVTNTGGSFYLQSKVYRARELLKEFHQEKQQQQQQQQQNASDEANQTKS